VECWPGGGAVVSACAEVQRWGLAARYYDLQIDSAGLSR
jgi:hypothetical protein